MKNGRKTGRGRGGNQSDNNGKTTADLLSAWEPDPAFTAWEPDPIFTAPAPCFDAPPPRFNIPAPSFKPQKMNRKRLEDRNVSMLRVRLPLHLVNRLEGVAVTNGSTKSQEVRKALEKALPAL